MHHALSKAAFLNLPLLFLLSKGSKSHAAVVSHDEDHEATTRPEEPALPVAALWRAPADLACDGVWGGDLPGAKQELPDLLHDLSRLEDQAGVEWCAGHGRACLTKLLTVVHGYHLQHARRVVDTKAVVEALHRASRFLELLLPGMQDDLLQCSLSVHRKTLEQLSRLVYPARIVKQSCTLNGPVVNILLTIVGRDFGTAHRATLNSLLYHTRCPVQIFVICDRDGCKAFTEAMQHSASESLVLVTNIVDVQSNPRYSEIFRRLPAECIDKHGSRRNHSWQGLSRVIMARAFLHEVLQDVDRIISLDGGDLLVLTDICRLWATFDWFNHRQLFAAAWESGAPQVSYEDYMGEVATSFWTKRGLLHGSKGINSGVLLLDLQRMRYADINGSSWTVAMINMAHHISHHSCGLEDLREQAMLSGFVFQNGGEYLYELSSTWNYIPGIPWELADNDADGGGMPVQALGSKIHPGLRPGGRMIHACPSYLELVGEWVLWQDTDKSHAWWIERAKEYLLWFNTFSAPGFYTRDVQCGKEISVVHMSGYVKLLPWSQDLLDFWSRQA